ncbi:MAG: DMT family transporter [Alphaproteobacteria bacterium]|nr:MAG: DMT family transporter [Alphaproteobacteria bacterium]
MCRLKSRQEIRAESVRFHMARGLIQLLSVLLYFYSVTLLPLAVATILSFTSVLFLLPVAALVLGERVSAAAGLAAAAGFVGTAITVLDMTGPGHPLEMMRPAGVAAGLASGCLTAVLLVLLRLRSASEDPYVISMFTNVVPAIILSPILMGMFGAPAPMEILVFFILGGLGYCVWILLSVAYARAPAQALAPMEYLSVAIAALYGYAFFGEGIVLRTIVGGSIIISACFLVARTTPTLRRYMRFSLRHRVLHAKSIFVLSVLNRMNRRESRVGRRQGLDDGQARQGQDAFPAVSSRAGRPTA